MLLTANPDGFFVLLFVLLLTGIGGVTYWLLQRDQKREQQAEADLRERIRNDPVITAANNQRKSERRA